MRAVVTSSCVAADYSPLNSPSPSLCETRFGVLEEVLLTFRGLYTNKNINRAHLI